MGPDPGAGEHEGHRLHRQEGPVHERREHLRVWNVRQLEGGGEGHHDGPSAGPLAVGMPGHVRIVLVVTVAEAFIVLAIGYTLHLHVIRCPSYQLRCPPTSSAGQGVVPSGEGGLFGQHAVPEQHLGVEVARGDAQESALLAPACRFAFL